MYNIPDTNQNLPNLIEIVNTWGSNGLSNGTGKLMAYRPIFTFTYVLYCLSLKDICKQTACYLHVLLRSFIG